MPGNLTCEPFGDSGYYCVKDTTVTNAAAVIKSANGVETPYNTVEQAVKALADGDTLTLKTDFTGTIAVQEKNIVIDLGGHTVTATGLQANAVNIAQSATESNTVTVKNGHLVAKDQSASAIHAIMNDATSETLTLALEDVTLVLSHPSAKQSLVRLGNGARTAVANKAYVTNGGLQVAESDGTWIYGTANTAFTHANGSTVTLLNDWYNTDYDGAVRVPKDASYTSAVLDLNGNTIEYYGSVSAIAIGGSGNNYVDGTNAKSLTVKNGTINANSGSGAAIGGSNKTLILDGVTLTTTGTDNKYGIFTNGMTKGNTVTLTNSSITAENCTGIYFPGAGKLTVENTNVTGGVSGIEIRAGVLDVSGDSAIKSTAAEFKFEDNDNGTTTTGAAIAAVKHGVGNDLTVNIGGGTFSGLKALYQADPNTATGGDVTMSVTGGTFNGAVTAVPVAKFISGGTFTEGVDETYLADGYVYNAADKTVNADTSVAAIGTTKYASLAAAIKAAQNGETVTLLKDITLSSAQSINSKKLTLDLNGKVLNYTGVKTVTLGYKADLTVKDSVGGGKISNAWTKASGESAAVYLSGAGSQFTLISGTIESTSELTSLNSVAIRNKSGQTCTVNINGGSVVVPKAATDGRAIVAGENMTLNVSGGTIAGGLHGVDAYSGSNVTITDGEITARVVDTGVIKEAYGMRITGTANVTVDGGTITGVKMDDNGYKPDVPNVTLKSGEIKGSFYSITKADITFTVAPDAEITFANDTVKKFLPDTVELVETPAGTYGVAKAKVYVAKIGDTKYETLKEAIDAANTDDTITLLDDVNLDKGQYLYSIAPDKKNVCNLTFDLGGHTITSSSTSYTVIASREGLVIKNGTIENTASTTSKGAIYATFSTKGTHSLRLENVTVIAKDTGIYAITANGDATVTIGDKTTINAATGIKVVGADTEARTGTLKLNVSAGTVTGTKCGIHVTDPTNKNEIAAVTVTITGGEVSSVTTVSGNSNRAAAVIISGGTVTGDLKNAGKDVITITGGTFKGAVTKKNTKGTISISGGTFAIEPDTTYLAEGYTITQNPDDGTYGVTKDKVNVAEVNGKQYESLQAAIDVAAEKATVTLLADTRENVAISTNRLTLDLNGHTLNGGTEKGKPALTVTARNVTVKDSSEAQTGTIMREDTAENSGVSSHYVIDVQGKGLLFFESGNVKNDSGNAEGEGASLVRVGDNSKSDCPQLTIRGGTFTQNNFIAIKVDLGTLYLNDGEVNSANSYAIENWHNATIKGGTVKGAVVAWTYSGGQKSDLTISGGTVNGDVTSVNYGSAEGKVAKVSITGGTVNGELDTRSYDPETGELTHSDDATKATIKITGGTFSSDPTKYLVEGSTATKNSDGTFGVEKAYLAKVGDTSYYTMDEAFKAQTTSGEAIVLLRDYTTGGTFNSGSINRTVDLNGFTWTCTGTDANSAAFEVNYPDVTLTVKRGKVASSQLVGLIPSAMGGTIKYDNSGLVFEGVEMSTTATSGIETNGNNTNDTVTLRNSTLNVPNGFGIYFPSSGTLTIDNSTITAKTMGVQVCAGSLSITGEKTAITVTGDAVEKTEGDGAIQDGAAISIVNRNGYKGLGEIAVTGGTFTAKKGNAAIKAYNWNSAAEAFTESGKVAVSGGTFSSAVDADLCKTGYAPTVNEDGTYTVTKVKVAEVNSTQYDTLEAAIAAAKTGDTVKLLADVEQNARLVIDKSITLDLNGKKICNTRDIWNESNALIGIGTDETHVKVTITGSGTIAAKENDCYTIDVKNGDLTIENGEFIGNVSAVQVQTGTLTINGGKFSLLQKWNDKSTYLINCIDGNFADGSAKVAIYGGTFVDFDPNVSPEKKVDGKAPSFAAEGVGITKNSDGTFTALPNKVAQTLDANGNSVYCYDSLEGALRLMEVKDGYTVRVLQDTTVENQLPAVKSSITIDGQGYTVTLDDSCYVTYYISVEQNNKLKLSNVTITGATDIAPLLHIKGNAEVTIDKDSSIIATSATMNSDPAIFIGVENGASGTAPTLNIYGRVEGKFNWAIAGNGTDSGTSHINIYDGAVVKSEKLAMFLPQPCEVNITGGTVEGYCAIGIKSGTLNITGGQVLGVAENNELSDNNSVGSGMQYDGSAIVIDSHTGYKGNVNINISGSAFIQSRCSTGIREIGNDADMTNVKRLSISGGTVLSGSGMDAVQVREVTKKTVSITGGRFSTDVAAYCATDYQCNAPTEDEPLYTVTKKDAVVTVSRKLTLANNLIITYTAKMPADYEEPYAAFNFWNNSVNEWQTSKVEGIATGTDADGNATYTFAFTGVNPQRMNDTLKMTLFAKTPENSGFVAITKEYTDSVAAYCNAVINNSAYNVNSRWTEVLSNLVAYGAASQKYMKYNETALVTDSVLNCVTKDYTGTQEITAVSGVRRKDGGITITSVGMVLSSSYAVRVFFTLNDTTSLSDVTFTANIGGSEQSFSKDDFTEQSYNGGTRYYFDYTGLNARQLDSKITFTATVSGTPDDTLGYSANTYLQYYITNNPSANTVWNELVKWLFNYGWSCKNL